MFKLFFYCSFLLINSFNTAYLKVCLIPSGCWSLSPVPNGFSVPRWGAYPGAPSELAAVAGGRGRGHVWGTGSPIGDGGRNRYGRGDVLATMKNLFDQTDYATIYF